MRTKETELAGWGRALRATAEVARPERAGAVLRLMDEAPAPAIGALRSYGDAALTTGGRAILTTRLDRMLAFDEDTGILTAEGGIPLGEIARIFAPRGWLLPVMPGTGFATVGGAVANDVHGKNHHRVGSFAEHVTGLRLATPSGEKTAASGDPLFRATAGGLGQTGAILSADIRMLRAKGDVIVVTERRIADWDEFVARLDGSDATYSVGWIDATATGGALGRGILEEAETGAGLVPQRKGAKAVPLDAPASFLSPAVVRAFNAAYWRRVPASGRTVVRPIHDFFFPLDRIRDWNRLYGKRGFHQFQCVVPLQAAGLLREMLHRIATSGLASPLAVLKRMGPGRAGLMSFPMEGYTLAVDFPNRDGAAPLIRDLTARARDAGGRIYFAKDALARAEDVEGTYPDRARWTAEVAKVDPDGRLVTDLVRRLDLRRA